MILCVTFPRKFFCIRYTLKVASDQQLRGIMDLNLYIRDFLDFPKPGILFKDISPILASAEAMSYVCDQFCEHFSDKKIDLIAGAESRGLIFACAVAARLNKGMIMIRKKGKLPGPTLALSYEIEYGSAIMEIQKDAIKRGQNVLLIDDLLATGGTASAAEQLILNSGANVIGHAFVIELTALNGRKLIKTDNVISLVQFDSV